jgi:hypothetical protein
MAKCDPPESYLRRPGGDEIELAFNELERILGRCAAASGARSQW